MSKKYDTPLSMDEMVALGELLAQIPEPYEPMEPDTMDGFLTALLLLPNEVSPAEWMPFVFDAEGREEAKLPNLADQDILEELVYRRYRSLDSDMGHCNPIDPIVFPIEDEKGMPIKGFDSILAITPFALGFYEAFDRWDGLKGHDDELVNSALLGIFRHLPEELLGDLTDVVNDLNLESPIENLDQAIEDIAVSVAEIAHITRGIPLKSDSDAPKGKDKKPKFKGANDRKKLARRR